MHIEQVKKYVASSLLCAVVLLHSLAMAALGATGADKGGAREGLFVISLLLGVMAVAGVRLINRLSLATPWFLLTPVIPLLVYYFVLWR
ncbi:transcriptional regulator [Nocardioides luteus]|uniref:transcriptional regulator n=1 Tax=Nocardioides luteus TaxID=1844 RepID=UPI0018C919F4|nr:transcriptional regulator [Nocardioides luteus]MBG6094560.1 putative membrane protein [Nocardioides luteus]